MTLPLLSGCIVVPAPFTMRASGTFHGRVLDADEKSVVAGASVGVTGYPKTIRLTGPDGKFTVGPARKWYWYFIVGLHQHWIPEPHPPEVVSSITITKPAFEPTAVKTAGEHWDRAVVKKSFEVGDILMRCRRPPEKE